MCANKLRIVGFSWHRALKIYQLKYMVSFKCAAEEMTYPSINWTRKGDPPLCVTACNPNGPGLQSPLFRDHIIGIYRHSQDHIPCQ